MALAANKIRAVRSAIMAALQVRNTSVVYKGSFLALGSPDHGTAAARGRVFPFTAGAGEILLPFAERKVTGDTGASPIPEAEVDVGAQVLENVAVTGATGIAADQGKPVYLSDDDTLTLTRPTRGIPIGMVLRYLTGTSCDVLLFGLDTLLAIGLGGAGQELMYLGSFDADTITAADLRTGIPMPFAGKINSVFAMVDVAITGAGGTALINLEIDGTNVTGGVVTVSTAAGGTKGTKLAGTAVTAANYFSEGSVIDIEAATVTDMTAGRFDLYMEVERVWSL